MKCVFDKPLKPHDTILMNLYKRVFPKWTYDSRVAPPSQWMTEDKEKEDVMQL